jgi:hypothetical protein
MSASEAAVGEAKPGLLQRYLPILDWLPTVGSGKPPVLQGFPDEQPSRSRCGRSRRQP